jgi:hypothetical protein
MDAVGDGRRIREGPALHPKFGIKQDTAPQIWYQVREVFRAAVTFNPGDSDGAHPLWPNACATLHY